MSASGTASIQDGATNRSRGWLALAALWAAAIFLIDTFSPLDMAIAVLYVVVVLFAASFVERAGLLIIAGACIALTVLSFVIMHADNYTLSATMRGLVSIAAITVTTLLSLRNQEATRSLRDQAALLDLSHDAIFVRDTADIITSWNHGAEQLYGWSRVEAVGQEAAALLQTRFPAPREQIVAEVLRTGRWDGELVHTTRDGRSVTTLSRWSLQRDARGRPIATMETNSDITERKRAENELHQAQVDLAHVTRVTTMGELTASIAHEVNQPLAAIVTNGEACLRWLRRPVPDMGEAEVSVERMIANARRASEVVARLRALARRSEPLHVQIDLGEVIEETVMLIERELSNHGVRLHLAIDPALPPVLGDRVQLQQVVINLALNAIQAMDGAADERRRLRISAAPDDNDAPGVAITVEDDGPGVDEEKLPVLFNPFFSTKKDGMGLGLSISRSIVEAHGGRIFAARGDGTAMRGMRFTLVLPLAKESVS
ncbi:nitrogen regulation protein NR(II) [Xanthobacter autotrophicus]|uniref:two-component system sensor histidine kinase NtrB n=1 Tax=Xanthobacter autotrophicus TaxID=280 RepID=UPI003728EBC2